MKNVRFNLFDKKNFNRLKLIDSIFASLTVKIFVVSIYNFIFSFFLSVICSFQLFFLRIFVSSMNLKIHFNSFVLYTHKTHFNPIVPNCYILFKTIQFFFVKKKEEDNHVHMLHLFIKTTLSFDSQYFFPNIFSYLLNSACLKIRV